MENLGTTSGPLEVSESQPKAATQSHALATPDSTRGCIPHLLTRYYANGKVKNHPSGARAFFWAIAITYLPIVIAAVYTRFVYHVPLATRTLPVLKLPFLYDMNVAFLFLASFPTLVVLTVTDHDVLTCALRQIQTDGVLLVPRDAAKSLSESWKRRFFLTNIASQLLGLVVGVVVVYVNCIVYVPAEMGFWIAKGGVLLPVGYALLWSIFLFYALVPVYVFRSLAISLFLKDIVNHSKLHLLPFHPDRSGGLRPVGRLGVRNQYVLSVGGVNVVLFFVITLHFLGPQQGLYAVTIAAATAYVLCGPFVFLGPLLPFRAGMLRTKSELMGEIAERLRIELDRLREKLTTSALSKEDEESVDRLRKLGALVDELPVWPFDVVTVRKFLAAYLLPLIGSLSVPLLKALIEFVAKR